MFSLNVVNLFPLHLNRKKNIFINYDNENFSIFSFCYHGNEATPPPQKNENKNWSLGSSPCNFGYIELFSMNVPHCIEFIQLLFTTIYIEMTSKWPQYVKAFWSCNLNLLCMVLTIRYMCTFWSASKNTLCKKKWN